MGNAGRASKPGPARVVRLLLSDSIGAVIAAAPALPARGRKVAPSSSASKSVCRVVPWVRVCWARAFRAGSAS